jgi:hypothetical protein
MNWIKSSLAWPVWSGSTLLASLSIHGVLLTLPLAAQKEPPKPETLAAVPITAIPAETTTISSPKQPEPEQTVKSLPQPDQPSVQKSESLFDRFPSRNWSSFPERVESFPRQPKEQEEPVEEIEKVEETEEAIEKSSDSRATQVSRIVDTTESTEPQTPANETPHEPKVDTDRFDRSFKPKPKLQPSQPPLSEEESPEVVKSQLQDVLGDIRGDGDFSDVKGIDIFTMLYGVPNLERLQQFFTTDNKNNLKPEIDPNQFRFIENQKPDEVHAKLSKELDAQQFSITPVTKPIPGVYEGSDLYEVKKGSVVVSYVNLVELGETGTLFVVWNQLPS